LRLTLIENALDSLREALDKVALAQIDARAWKFAVLNVVHTVELVIKYRLQKEHPLLVWADVDRPKQTVSLQVALERLQRVGVTIDAADQDAIRAAIHWRNNITHYETEFLLAEVQANFLVIFEFLDTFYKREFGEDLTSHLDGNHASIAAGLIADFRRVDVTFQGRPMRRSWPAQLLAAQRVLELMLDGVLYKRIRHGDELESGDEAIPRYPTPDTCHDCEARVGDLHGPGCDSERCPRCSGQLLSCACNFEAPANW